MSAKVSVLGGGSWGTTVASTCARNTTTLLWARDAATVEEINTRHRNSRYLGDLPLTKSLRATADLGAALAGADVVVMGMPSHSFRTVLHDIAPRLRPGIPVVSLAKGLEQGSRLRMTQVVQALLPGHPVGVLAGPNIAREIAQGLAAAALLAMPDHGIAERLQNLFRTSRFRVYTGGDVIGAEIAGALKNVYAIATGIGDGLGAGDNTRAMVITRSLRELSRLGVALGGQSDTFSGLAGMGDLIATCTSAHSRNRRVGIGLAQGKTAQQVCAKMGQVAEGVKTAAVVMQLAVERGIAVPIAAEMDAVLNRGQPVAEAYRGLLRQAPGHEVHGAAP